MSVLDRIKALRDIGIPADMRPEDAKYIRALNTLIFVSLVPLSLMTLLVLKEGYLGLVIYDAILIFFVLLVLVFNKSGYYTVAQVYIILLLNIMNLIACMITGSGRQNILSFFVCTLAPMILIPRKQKKMMIALSVLGLVCFAISKEYIYERMVPLVSLNPDDFVIIPYFAIIMTMLISFVGRSFTDQAEDRLAEERVKLLESEERLKEEKNKVTRLSEKLKVYLPQQLVNSIGAADDAANDGHRRKRLTIFFSDVQGFTKWTDKLEPEEVRELLNSYLTEMSKIALKWGGTIDKFIGDSLMIFFGDPEHTNDKDHAVRCVNMAIEMQNKMNEMRSRWRKMAYDEPLNIRIGVNTGWATVGNFGSEDRLNYTALGSAVNLASRIENACAPDKITVSHTTYLLIEDCIKCEPKGMIDVKGFNEPVRIYEVVGDKIGSEN